MYTSLHKSYGAGYRAGRAEPKLIKVGAVKYVVTPQCPFKGRHILKRFAWSQGLYIGTMERIKASVYIYINHNA